MTGLAMGVTVVLAAYFAVSSATALAVRYGCAAAGRDRLVPAGLVLRLRLAPAVVGAALAFGVVAPAFLVFEPRQANERAALSLVCLAAGGAGLLAASAFRVLRQSARTRRLVGQWARGARRIDLPGCPVPAYAVGTVFPVVAVVGIGRPRLFVGAALLRRLAPAELAAVVSHEVGHLRARDNLKRLLLTASVDVLSWTARAREMDERWQEAVEDAADDHAARAAGSARLDLAEALLKVARLSGSLDLACPASALFRGERVARRVRRLLDLPARAPFPAGASRPYGALLGSAALAAAFGAAVSHPGVHAALEALIQALP